MARIGSFGSRAHADMAAMMLDARGIPAATNADDAGGAAPHLPTGMGGFWVEVPDERAEEARALLDDESPSESRVTTAQVADRRARMGVTVRVAVLLLALVVLGAYLVDQLG